MFYRSLTDKQTLRVRRARPVMALAGVAFAIGAHFVADWAKHDYRAMYLEIDPATRRTLSPDEFASAYGEAMKTATATSLHVTGRARGASGGFVAVPVHVNTRLFGRLALSV